MTVRHDGVRIDWYGYATIRIEGEDAVVYLDPGRYDVLEGYRPADGDLVCVTHDHHYDPDGIDRVAGDDATLLVAEGVDAAGIDRVDRAPGDLGYDLRRVRERDRRSVDGVDVATVPAYNDPEGPHVRPDGTPYHPEGAGVGYQVVVDGVAVLWPGDTDRLPLHDDLQADVLCPPIGGSFTMDRHGAADLAERVDPALVVPVHYDTFPDLAANAEAFAGDVAGRGVPVVLDEESPFGQ